MNSHDLVLAKSLNYGNITLFEHTQQVVSAIKVFAKAFELNVDIAIKGAIIHDLGKAHPYFQNKIKRINAKSLFEKNRFDYTHRHEISSLAFLPVFDKFDWNPIIDMVIGHHKSIKNDKGEKGILDLIENDRYMIEHHLEGFEEWQIIGNSIMNSFGIKVREISKEEASKSINYAIEYCKKKKAGWSKWRGLLMAADHFASAFMKQTDIKLQPLFKIPKLDFYFDEERISDLYPLSKTETSNDKKHTIVVAPTGAGKTDFLMKRCTGRIFYTLPFQASINAMWERIGNVY
jgi:CRISPR-associated endonuclease/helicase Cas3